VTDAELARLLDQYGAGLRAEMTLLRQLSDVAARQRDVTADGDMAGFTQAADERDRLMQSLVRLEAGLREVRATLAAHPEAAGALPGFEALTVLHRDAAQLVNDIMATDQRSMSALADAELARRSAVAGLERGETTLAAYRKVLTPPVASATLVNRRG
jgi:hypothetical protein